MVHMGKKGMGDAGYVALALIGIVILSGVLVAWVYWGSPGTVVGNGNVTSRSFGESAFTSVQVGGGFVVNITQGDAYSVNITTDSNIFDVIIVSNANGVLQVMFKPGVSVVSPTALRVEVTMPAVSGVDLSGGSVGRLAGFVAENGTRLTIVLSGGSLLAVPQANVGSFSISLSGGSSINGIIYCAGGAVSNFMLSGASSAELSGVCGNVTMDASGASSLHLTDMAALNVNAVLSSASSAWVNMTGVLNADLSGASLVRYTGSPTMGNIVLTGGSTVGPA